MIVTNHMRLSLYSDVPMHRPKGDKSFWPYELIYKIRQENIDMKLQVWLSEKTINRYRKKSDDKSIALTRLKEHIKKKEPNFYIRVRNGKVFFEKRKGR